MGVSQGVSFSFKAVTHQHICWVGRIFMRSESNRVSWRWNLSFMVTNTMKHSETSVETHSFHSHAACGISCVACSSSPRWPVGQHQLFNGLSSIGARRACVAVVLSEPQLPQMQQEERKAYMDGFCVPYRHNVMNQKYNIWLRAVEFFIRRERGHPPIFGDEILSRF